MAALDLVKVAWYSFRQVLIGSSAWQSAPAWRERSEVQILPIRHLAPVAQAGQSIRLVSESAQVRILSAAQIMEVKAILL